MKVIFLILCILVVAGCAQQQEKSSALIPVEERNVPDKQQLQEIQSRRAAQAESTVIVSLIDDAELEQATGNTANAVSILERGLRIDPSNARLWYQLATVRLQQQQWQQAISLARKSIALTEDQQLKSDNWGIIATAYQALGDVEKSKQAEEKQRLNS